MSVIERLLRRDGNEQTDEDSARRGVVSISPMKRRDLRRGVMDIEVVSYPRSWSRNVFESELAQTRSGSRCYVVARRADTGGARRGRAAIVGYAGLWFTEEEAHVTNVAVRPSEQRHGVASALLLTLAEEAIRREATAWTLEVRSSSVGAQDLYRGFGFAPAGVRTRYYENTEDAIVMWCSDIQLAAYRSTLDERRQRLRERGVL